MKAYIKNLEYKFFFNFGNRYLSVDYNRGGEHNHYTLSDIPDSIWNNQTEQSVRKFINS